MFGSSPVFVTHCYCRCESKNKEEGKCACEQDSDKQISLTSQNVSTSKDGSTEFVFAEKKFPLHMREDCAAVFLEGLDEGACVHMVT